MPPDDQPKAVAVGIRQGERVMGTGGCRFPGAGETKQSYFYEWGEVIRRDRVTYRSLGRDVTTIVFEVEGVRGRYLFDGVESIAGELRYLPADPGDLVVFCPVDEPDGVTMPEGWRTAPFWRVNGWGKLSRPPAIAALEPRPATLPRDLAERPPAVGAVFVAHAPIAVEKDGRFALDGAILQVPDGVTGAELVVERATPWLVATYEGTDGDRPLLRAVAAYAHAFD
jgi:hypothetical protein